MSGSPFRRSLPAVLLAGLASLPVHATPLQVFGVWHAGDDACIWGSARSIDGVPIGMTSDIVSCFGSHGIRVMLSIGGIT